MINEEQVLRLHLTIRGAVQGVGFRPFIYRLATEMELTGWVINSSQGVFIEVEASEQRLRTFLLRVAREKPPRSFIHSLEHSFLDPIGYTEFEIRRSDDSGTKTVIVLPDIATCSDCLKEVLDPTDRRYLYPFTNCTNCGPRFSIIEALPYDRRYTAMKSFLMCEMCQAEYENPLDRRFHAQPNACPTCGPHLQLWDNSGRIMASRHDALLEAAQLIRRGAIIGVKGLGGFHLMVDACNPDSVRQLRQRKDREEKPFAIMFPTLESIKVACEVSELEERLLVSPESPIVLVRRKSMNLQSKSEMPIHEIDASIAPGNPYLGVMLPYTPLHHLLMRELQFPLVATSGNLSDEPICTDEQEALKRLGGIVGMFLVHNRPIARHVDDSIVRVMMGREFVLRRARGYAPLPLHLKERIPSVLAVGAHLKNTIAISVDRDIFVSQHIGDLETAEALNAFHRVIENFQQLYDVHPEVIACDAHPDYLSTKFARQYNLPVVSVQHHIAHVVSCMVENELDGPVLAVSWDGTGYGFDDTIWGGEFFRGNKKSFRRVAHFRTFRLPGGEKAIKEPRRTAIGLLYEIFGDGLFERKELAPVKAFTAQQHKILMKMLTGKINSPRTSSAGRLFDAVAAITNLHQQIRFEGQAAMELEFSSDGFETEESYPLKIDEVFQNDLSNETRNPESVRIFDWEPLVKDILEDLGTGVPVAKISVKFHNTLIEAIVSVAHRTDEERVVLTGGCFQNKYLLENTIQRLKSEGFLPYWHQRIPPNDGGIALGQVMVAAYQLQESKERYEMADSV